MVTLAAARACAQLETWGALPPVILERLRAEGLETPERWRTAGKRRRMVFGVTASWVAQLDVLAQQVPS